MNYLITYEDAKEICEKYNNFNFSEHLFQIDGFKISLFDYFICDFNDFNNPLHSKQNVNAFDMRGITFVFNTDGTLWKRFLMLPKFFNLNQVELTQYSNVKDKKIKHISSKEDGSLIAFMMLPNERIFAKTIAGFTNEQSENAMILLEKSDININWVSNKIKEGFTPLFEYVSFNNRIVLQYTKSELRFIGLRNNINGDYIPASLVNDIPNSIIYIKEEKTSLDKLIERCKTEKDIEGWVVIFDNGLMIKVKSDWYCNIHGLRTENIFREDFIIENYYKETLDDIICQLDNEKDKDALDFVKNVIASIDNYFKHIDNSVNKMYHNWQNNFPDFKEFATRYHKEPYFEFLRYFENKVEYRNRIIDFILKKSWRLNNAREIVNKYKN